MNIFNDIRIGNKIKVKKKKFINTKINLLILLLRMNI